MSTLVLMDRLSGEGTLSSKTIAPIPVRYEIAIRQWDGQGTYQIDADLWLPQSAIKRILMLYAQGSEAVLTLSDGRRARVEVPNLGGPLGRGPRHLRCPVIHLDGV